MIKNTTVLNLLNWLYSWSTWLCTAVSSLPVVVEDALEPRQSAASEENASGVAGPFKAGGGMPDCPVETNSCSGVEFLATKFIPEKRNS